MFEDTHIWVYILLVIHSHIQKVLCLLEKILILSKKNGSQHN